MKILVINAGSSSLKYQLLQTKTGEVLCKGVAERIGLSKPFISYKHGGKSEEFAGAKTHEEAIEKVLKKITDKKDGVISDLSEIEAVGHRVVQGGWIFNESVLATDEVIKKLQPLSALAPLHNPANLQGLLACKKAMPNVPHVLVFDTAFHSTMPEKAYTYAINYDDAQKYHLRKYGAHGSSHKFVTLEAAKILGKKVKDVNLIVCHLGNGSSLTAVRGGKSVDTTMGLTPLQGVVMGTRSGDIDPTVVAQLCKCKGFTVDEAINYLNKECGLLGVSGFSSDQRDLLAATDNPRATLALDVLNYSVKKHLGSYLAVLGKVDAIVFTGGIGENSAPTRQAVLEGLEPLGIELDKRKNTNFHRGEVELISKPTSKVKVYIIPTNEELMMARDTEEIAKKVK